MRTEDLFRKRGRNWESGTEQRWGGERTGRREGLEEAMPAS